MLSAILFLSVLIHFALIPTLELMRRPQKNFAKACPMIDFLDVCMVQFFALMLSVMHNTTGLGSLHIVECCQCSAVIYNNCNIFQAVVGDEGTVFVVLEM